MNKIQSILEESWSKPSALSVLLLPFSILYGFAILLRSKLYSIGLLSAYSAPIPVVIVGNLTVGGTGKTPLVIHLVEELKNAGYKPAVVSRGYRSKAPSYPYLVTIDSPVKESGDEPALIARRTEVPVMIGSNRQRSIERLMSDFEVDVIVCDDGLQHLALQRDIEICVTSPELEQQNTMMLPAGPYREPLSSIKGKDFIVSSKSSSRFSTHVMVVHAEQPVPILEQMGASFDASSAVHLVCGIASPERFFKSCELLGYRGHRHVFPDHHIFQPSDISFGDQLPVLMTEKDAVKCEEYACAKHWMLPVGVKLQPNLAAELIERLKNSSKND